MTVSARFVPLYFLALMPFVAGCPQRPPVTMAPPVAPPPAYQPPVSQAPPVAPGQPPAAQPTGDSVYPWTEIPAGQKVPITRAVFDQGGYQLFAGSGETIIVPFVNQNMYVMKFGRSDSGGMYFVNDGAVPTLYVPNGGYLENAVAQNARWYPFPQNYNYTAPVYVGIAPSWGAFTGMGWYPGMTYHGGYWGASPFGIGAFTPMIGLNFNIGGRPYYGWNSYNNYYRSNPNAVRMRTVYNNYSTFGRARPTGTGSFGSGGNSSFGRRTGYGNSSGSGSFGSGRPTLGGSGYGRQSGSGSFGTGSATRPSFGSGSGSGGSFGSGNRPAFDSGASTSRPSFGSGTSSRPPFGSGGSFGGGSSGYNSSARRGSGSFGSGSSSGYRSSRPSFGGSSSSGYRSSGGGGSFGGSRRSSGGSFGGRRR